MILPLKRHRLDRRPGIALALSLTLFSVAAALAQAPQHPPERGRELIATDGRTLTDRQNKYSIRLPAPAWKVYRDVDGPEPILTIANPNWEQRLEVHVRALPIALEIFKQYGEAEAKKTGTTFQRSAISVQNGMRCWDSESDQELPSASVKGVQHMYGRVCDLDAGHKLTLGVMLPAAQWAAEGKVIREMAESVRINP